MATVGSILISLGADASGFNGALLQTENKLTAFTSLAERRTNVFANVANRNFNTAGRSIERFSGIAKAAIGGLLAGITSAGVVGITRQFHEVARGIATIGDEAKRAGLSSRAFQELGYVAQQNRINVDALIDGVKELHISVDDYVLNGGGRASESFKRLGYDADTLKRKIQNPSQLFSEIIGKLGQLDRAARVNISENIFGGEAGERFVQLVDQGEASIKRTIREAHALNLVLEDDLIESAAELDRRFNAISTTVSTSLKRGIIEAAEALGIFIDRFQDFEKRGEKTITSDLAAIGEQRLAVENELLRLRNLQREGATYADDGVLGTGIGASVIEARIAELERENEALAAQERMIMDVVKARQAEAEVSRPRAESQGGPARHQAGRIDLPDSVSVKPERRVDPYFDGPEKEATTAVNDHAAAVRELIAELEFQALGMTERQQEIANALRRAGAHATAAQRAEISALVGSIYDGRAAADAQRQAVEDMRTQTEEALGSFFSDFKSALTDGDDVGKALVRSILGVANKSLDRFTDQLVTSLARALFPDATPVAPAASNLLTTATTVPASAPVSGGGGDVASQAWSFFKAKGLQDHQVAGIMGNIRAESGFRPDAIGDGGLAHGLFQHHPGRGGNASLIASGAKGQLEHAWRELMGPENRAYQALVASKDVRGATAAFAGFERPKGFSWQNPEGAHNFAGRLSGAESALAQFAGKAGSAAKTVDSMATASVGATKGLAGLANMFPQAPGSPAAGAGGLGSLLGGLFGGGASLSPSAFNVVSSGAMTGLFHGGGIAGFASRFKRVDPAVFVNAPRYHEGTLGAGLAPDEVPAILRRGEPVFKSLEHAKQVVGNDNGSGPVNLIVNVQGGSGDDHIRKLARQGAQESLMEYQKGMVRGGFGEMQRRYTSQKG